MTTFKIEYADRVDEVMDIVSVLLRPYGLEIVCDNLEHAGFNVYTLKTIDGHESAEDRVRKWVEELRAFSDVRAIEKFSLLKQLSWVLNEPIVTAIQQEVHNDMSKLRTWFDWVDKPIVKKSGKPFPDHNHTTVAGRIITNQHTGNPSFVIGGNDQWCVECRMCKLAE